MFVQSEEFIQRHGGRIGDISIYGQESNPTTWRLAKMNLALRGIEANLGPHHADTFRNDMHTNMWRIGEFGSVLQGGTRNGIYKSKEFHGRGTKIVNMGELFASPHLDTTIPMQRLELSDEELNRFELRKGDLLFARRSLVAEGAGKCSIVQHVAEPTTFESSIIRARPDPTKANSSFLFYLFSSPIGLHLLDTISSSLVR